MAFLYVVHVVIADHDLYGVWLSSDLFFSFSAQLGADAEPARGDGERARLTRSAVVDRAMQLADAPGSTR